MTDLTDQLRTCVAGLQTIEVSIVLTDAQMEAIIDARHLLLAAADELEKPIEVRLGTPMEVIPAIEPPLPNTQIDRTPQTFWVGMDPGIPDLPTQPLSKNACPKCDSRATKTVHVNKNGIFLNCPVCGNNWKR